MGLKGLGILGGGVGRLGGGGGGGVGVGSSSVPHSSAGV